MRKQVTMALTAAIMSAVLISGCTKQAGSLPQPATAAAETTAAETAATTAAPEESADTDGTSAPKEAQAADQLPDLTGHTLMIYCGAGMTKPFQEIADAFKAATNCEMNVTYGNAGQIHSQITATEEGDMFVAGSQDELVPIKEYISDSKSLVKHIPVLAVQSGNPKSIQTLKDLAKEDVSLIVGDAQSTPIGKIAMKALEDAGITDSVQIAATTTTAPQMSTALAAGEADAAIVWKENCKVDGVEIVAGQDMEPYIKVIPAANLGTTADQEALDAFTGYLDTEAANEIWIKYGYELAE